MQASTASRLSVLLVTDIVGSTDLKSRIGLSVYARLLAQHDSLFKSLVSEYPSAEILKDTGDGYFASFATTSDAVRFALRFQQALHDARWDPQPLSVRVGIHVGEVAQMEKESTGKPKLVGLAADVVARVTDLAQGGQILLTRFAFNEARQFVSSNPATPSRPLKWVAHGEYRLRGHNEPVSIFEVGAEGLAPLVAPPGSHDAHRAVAIDDEQTLGWRPAAGLEIPSRAHWVLDRRLGEGGFGEVWLAHHQRLGVRRVFKFCFDAERLRSFKREIALFRLLHDTLGDRKDIARLHEVKIDEPPYFLESDYTEGGDLSEWAQSKGGLDRVALATRVEIIARVADAVAAAHSVGVLHKDLKPSNILIAEENGQPRPRLADFGIGAITDRARLGAPAISETGFTPMTVDSGSTHTGTRLYAPPEVLVGRPFTVQGDIYALGIVLYQMVVADLNRPLAEGWESDVDDELLREDISACVQGDPLRRPDSASDVAKRLRSLVHRRAWNQRQQAEQRTARRRRRIAQAAIISTGALLILLGLVGAFAWREHKLRQREAEQRAIADAVGLFLMDMLTSVSPDTRQGRDVTVREALDEAARQIDQKKYNPEVEAFVRNSLSASYRSIGEPTLAEPHARKSVELIEKLRPQNDRDRLNFRGELGMILYELGDFPGALVLLRETADGLERTLGPDDLDTLAARNDLVLCLLQLEKKDEAEPIIDSLVEAYTRLRGPDDNKTLSALNTRAGLLFQRGKYAESAQKFGGIYETHRRTAGEDHPKTLLSAHNYASVLYRSGKVDEAALIMQRVVDSQTRVMGPEHPRTLDAMLNLSQMLKSKLDDAGAIAMLERVLEIRRAKLGEDHPDTLHTAGMLGASMVDAGREKEAEPLLRTTLDRQRRLLAADDTTTVNTISALARAVEEQDRFDEAISLHRQALDETIRIHGPEHPNVIHHRWLLGRCLVKASRFDEAEPVLLEGLRQAQNPSSPSPRRADEISRQLVILYESLGKPEQAAAYRPSGPATAPSTSSPASSR